MSESSSHSVPSWIWLFTGVATGLFLAFLYYLAGIQTPPTPGGANDTPAPPTPKTAQPSPSYEFYNLLPDVEVAPPQVNTPVARKPASKPTEISTLLQTGAFTLASDADRRRAEILLLGLDVNIAPVNVKGKTYHRVQVGPFSSADALANAKHLLSQNDIEHLERKLPLKN